MNQLPKVLIPWIRIHNAYPTGLTDEVLKALKDSKNIFPYFDLPIQHGHPDVLKSMYMPWQASLNESILDRYKFDHMGVLIFFLKKELQLLICQIKYSLILQKQEKITLFQCIKTSLKIKISHLLVQK